LECIGAKEKNYELQPETIAGENGEQAPVVYNRKITAVDEELQDAVTSGDVLVIIGLARPYNGSSHQFTKLRCSVIVVSFVTRSTNSQRQSPQSPLSVLLGEIANDDSSSEVLSPFATVFRNGEETKT